MNKNQQRALENKIRETLEEPVTLTPEEIESIRNRAHAVYQQRGKKQGKKKSGFLRRAVAVIAIAVGLIVVSMVYSVLSPVTVSNANNFIRRAAIWVNDQLHLGISFPVPEDEPNTSSNIEKNSFSSIQEASKEFNMPIVYIDGVEGLVYCGLETVTSLTDSTILLLHYKIGNGDINISIEKLLNGEVLNIDEEKTVSYSSPIGELFVLELDGENRALAFYKGHVIEVYGSLTQEQFQQCCSSLEVIN